MSSHLIGEAIFDIAFASPRQAANWTDGLSPAVQAQLLPVIEEVFDELGAQGRIRIDTLELDLGAVDEGALATELPQRLRRKLRDALRDYRAVQQSLTGEVVGPAEEASADVAHLGYFLAHGHLPWDAVLDESVSELMARVLRTADAAELVRLVGASERLHETGPRLVSQFSAELLARLADRVRGEAPELAQRLADAIKGDSEVSQHPERASDAQSHLLRSYVSYSEIRERFYDRSGAAPVVSATAAIQALQREYPWQLLRLYRELQAAPPQLSPDQFTADEFKAFVDAFLAVSDAGAGAMAELRRAVAAFAARSQDKSSFYAQVLRALLHADLIDLEVFATSTFLGTATGEPRAQTKQRESSSLSALGAKESHLAITGPDAASAQKQASERPVGNEPLAASGDAARGYELYGVLRRVLIDGSADTGITFMDALEGARRSHPWQLTRLYRELRDSGRLSESLVDLLSAEELHRAALVFLEIAESEAQRIEDAREAVAAQRRSPMALMYILERILGIAPDLHVAADHGRHGVPPLSLFAAPTVEKVRWIQATLRQRLQPLPERFFALTLSEFETAAPLMRTADAMLYRVYRAGAALPHGEAERLKWEMIFSDALVETPELHAAEFAAQFEELLKARRLPAGPVEQLDPQPAAQLARQDQETEPQLWRRQDEASSLYSRLRLALVDGHETENISSLVETAVTRRPEQVLRLMREMQAGDGLSISAAQDLTTLESRQVTQAFIRVSESARDALLLQAVIEASKPSGDADYYKALLVEWFARPQRAAAAATPAAAVIELLRTSGEGRRARLEDLARARVTEDAEQFRESAFPFETPLDDWIRGYELYERLRAILVDGEVGSRESIAFALDELIRVHPLHLSMLFRALGEAGGLSAAALQVLEAEDLARLIDAFFDAPRTPGRDYAVLKQSIASFAERATDLRLYYANLLERLVRDEPIDFEELLDRSHEAVGAPLRPSSRASHAPADVLQSKREVIQIAERILRQGPERLRAWVRETFAARGGASSTIAALPDHLLARIVVMSSRGDEARAALIQAERLTLAAMGEDAGLASSAARELKWTFLIHRLVIERQSYSPADFTSTFAVYIAPHTKFLDAAALANALSRALEHDGFASAARPERAEAPSGIELQRGLPIANAGLVLAGPYLPRLFANLKLVEDGAFRDFAAGERGMHALQFLATGLAAAPEHELTLNKILCGIDAETPVSREVLLTAEEQAILEGLLHGMIQNWKKLGQTSVAGFRESFLQRDGVLRFEEGAWRLDVAPRPFDMLLDYIPWSFSLIKHPWMPAPIHVTWRSAS